jgi:hypothetical protein
VDPRSINPARPSTALRFPEPGISHQFPGYAGSNLEDRKHEYISSHTYYLPMPKPCFFFSCHTHPAPATRQRNLAGADKFPMCMYSPWMRSKAAEHADNTHRHTSSQEQRGMIAKALCVLFPQRKPRDPIRRKSRRLLKKWKEKASRSWVGDQFFAALSLAWWGEGKLHFTRGADYLAQA